MLDSYLSNEIQDKKKSNTRQLLKKDKCEKVRRQM